MTSTVFEKFVVTCLTDICKGMGKNPASSSTPHDQAALEFLAHAQVVLRDHPNNALPVSMIPASRSLLRIFHIFDARRCVFTDELSLRSSSVTEYGCAVLIRDRRFLCWTISCCIFLWHILIFVKQT